MIIINISKLKFTDIEKYNYVFLMSTEWYFHIFWLGLLSYIIRQIKIKLDMCIKQNLCWRRRIAVQKQFGFSEQYQSFFGLDVTNTHNWFKRRKKNSLREEIEKLCRISLTNKENILGHQHTTLDMFKQYLKGL